MEYMPNQIKSNQIMATIIKQNILTQFKNRLAC